MASRSVPSEGGAGEASAVGGGVLAGVAPGEGGGRRYWGQARPHTAHARQERHGESHLT